MSSDGGSSPHWDPSRSAAGDHNPWLIAVVVYERFGVAFLHRAWFNVDLLWTVTLLIAGVITLFS